MDRKEGMGVEGGIHLGCEVGASKLLDLEGYDDERFYGLRQKASYYYYQLAYIIFIIIAFLFLSFFYVERLVGADTHTPFLFLLDMHYGHFLLEGIW